MNAINLLVNLHQFTVLVNENVKNPQVIKSVASAARDIARALSIEIDSDFCRLGMIDARINRHNLTKEEMDWAMDVTQKIPVIRMVRTRLGHSSDLKEVKDMVEDFMEDNKVPGFKRISY